MRSRFRRNAATILCLAALAACKKDTGSTDPGEKAGPGKGSVPSGMAKQGGGSRLENWAAELNAIADDGERLEFFAEMLATGDDELGERIKVALADPSTEIRREAMGAAGDLEAKALLSVIRKGVGDPDDFVRDYAIDHARRLPDNLKVEAFRSALVSEFPEIKDKAIRSLANERTPEAFGYLLEGLKDESPEVRESINRQAEALVERQFADYSEAQSWWEANKSKFDEDLLLIE